MREMTEATGFVLRSDPAGEYDRRLVLLTGQVGKITVFARGARRPGSPYLAACNTFTYGTYLLYEGKEAYSLAGTQDMVFFDAIASCDPGVYYGYYFLELAQFYGQENLEAFQMVSLLYATLRAVLREKVPLSLIRRVYECRMMVINGDFAVPEGRMDPAVRHALEYTAGSPMNALYAFALSDDAAEAFGRIVDERIRKITGGKMRSLSLLEQMTAGTH